MSSVMEALPDEFAPAAILPSEIHRHLAKTDPMSATDLFVKAWVDDQADRLLESMVTFFQFRESGTGELVMNVFGSGVLLERRGRILALTALSVAEQFGLGETYMQTHLGAVSLRKAICRLDRAQCAAICDVDALVRANAVLPNWTVPIIPPGGRAGATSLLYLGFPGTPNAFRKSRRPSSLEGKAVMVPYTGGNFIRTSVEQPLFLEWAQKIEVPGFERSSADISLDPKGMIGGPVFEIVTGVKGDLSVRLMAIAVEFRRDQSVMIAARTPTIEPLIDRSMTRSVHAIAPS